MERRQFSARKTRIKMNSLYITKVYLQIHRFKLKFSMPMGVRYVPVTKYGEIKLSAQNFLVQVLMH